MYIIYKLEGNLKNKYKINFISKIDEKILNLYESRNKIKHNSKFSEHEIKFNYL